MVENQPNRICEVHIDIISFQLQSAAEITPCVLNGRKSAGSHMRNTYMVLVMVHR